VNSDAIFLGLGYIGLIATMGCGIIGSCIGCAIAGLAADGAMLETETGHGRFLGVVAMPSSQSIYGIVLMFILRGSVSAATGVGVLGIGLLSGLAFMFSAIYQGQCCAMAINVSKSKPEIFAKSLVSAGIVEGFAIFMLAFALVLNQGLSAAVG
jgi:V/A-type H+-transporting ATPase subunit K